jgi:hypothetical protein
MESDIDSMQFPAVVKDQMRAQVARHRANTFDSAIGKQRELMAALLALPKPPMDSIRYVVRCAPLRPGKCWTVAVLADENTAHALKRYWTTFEYTECCVIEVAPGASLEGPLSQWERSYLHQSPREPSRHREPFRCLTPGRRRDMPRA